MREERRKKVCLDLLQTDLLQVNDWRLKRAWICAKLGELVIYLDYFDLVGWFEDWLSRASDLRGVSSVRMTVVSAQNSFGRCLVWDFGWWNGVWLSSNFISGQGTPRSTFVPKFVHLQPVVCEIWSVYRRGQNLWLTCLTIIIHLAR